MLMGINGKSFAVITLGCRANHYEAEALASMLTAHGAIYLDSYSENPDIIVIVTCSITSIADNKTRKIIRRLRREQSSAVIVACGCYAQGVGADEAEALGVDLLVGNRFKSEIPSVLGRIFGGERAFFELREDISVNRSWDPLFMDRPRIHTRAFIKIQDGCDRACSYCIVPSLRGASVSRSPDDILLESKSIVDSGCSEVVLTGVHLGSYHYEKTKLHGIIEMLSTVSGLKRLRLGSLEPFSVTDELLTALAESKIFCNHLHLPVQSGDDGVLRAMKRGYTNESFSSTIKRVRAALGDDIHLSTDLIVGFPGESEGAFENSLSLLSELRFGKVHVFPFSPRKGTEAALMKDSAGAEVRKERASRALKLSEGLLFKYAENFIGRDLSVLVENIQNGIVSGWSRNYLKVYALYSDAINCIIGDELELKPTAAADGSLLCDGVESSSLVGLADDI